MILINVRFPVREDKMDEWLALADSYSKAVNAEEGCVAFSFSRSLDDPNLFICVELFRDAVRLRLVSDVPLGVFLSGGIDSSAVVAMMCELMPPRQVKTFSIAFREKEYDESSHARTVAQHFGTDHHERVLDQQSMLERLPGLIAHMDEPFADESLSPTSLVSEFARCALRRPDGIVVRLEFQTPLRRAVEVVGEVGKVALGANTAVRL